jgi:DNA-binding NarL/FixJ family response regulator
MNTHTQGVAQPQPQVGRRKATPSIRVLIAEDQTLVRSGLRLLLEMEADINVVGEAADGQEAVDKARSLHPDVVLMDWLMPRKSGLAAMTEILRVESNARILVLTGCSETGQVRAALKAGALGYLPKSISPPELVRAIRTVYEGQAFLPPPIARMLMEALNESKDLGAKENTLTPGEKTVLLYLAQGLSNSAIAERLFVAQRTVRTYVSNILSKLKLTNRTQAALYALKHNLIREE